MRTGLVKVLLDGRLCTGILGNKKSDGTYSVVAFSPKSIIIQELRHSGKGALTDFGNPSVIVGTLIPEAVVFEPGRVTTHGVFFVDWDNDGAAEQMLEWYRYQNDQRRAIADEGPGETAVTDQSNAGGNDSGGND